MVRFGEVDERITPPIQQVLHAVKARAYAVRGDTHACHRHIALAETAHTNTTPAGGWQDTIATTAHLYAATGHAAATLARRADSAAARADAQHRLGQAIDQFDAAQARPAALAMAQLATLHLEAGELDHGVHWGRRVLDTAGGIRSHRLAEHLATVKTAADQHADQVEIKQLLADLAEASQ